MGLKHKYELNLFQIKGSSQEEEDEDSTPEARMIQFALISARYNNKLLHAKMNVCDVLRGVVVPNLKDPAGATPAN